MVILSKLSGDSGSEFAEKRDGTFCGAGAVFMYTEGIAQYWYYVSSGNEHGTFTDRRVKHSQSTADSRSSVSLFFQPALQPIPAGDLTGGFEYCITCRRYSLMDMQPQCNGIFILLGLRIG